MGAKGKFTLRACAAAIGCASCVGASAQSLGQPFEQIQAGLERASRLPLEITSLQSQILADRWRAPALAHFDWNPAPRPGPLVVSSFGSPKAPFANPRLNLSEGRRLLLVAGATVQLIDAAYPNIQIELSAPEDRPLLLGELAATEIGRIFALLAQPKAAPKRGSDVQRLIAKVVEEECTVPEALPPLALASIPDFAVALPAKAEPEIAAPISVPDLPLLAAALEKSETLPTAPPVQVALAPVVAPKAVASDLSKMRAEIDAEVARENERFTQMVRGAAPKQFRLGS